MQWCGVVLGVEDVIRNVLFDVALDGHGSLLKPVDPMSVHAVGVESYPSCFKTTCIELGAGPRVDLDRLSLHRDI